MACLDTSVLIDLMGRGGRRRAASAAAVLHAMRDTEPSLTTTRFNVAELLVGVERSNDRASEFEAMNRVLAGLEVLEFDEAGTLQFARIAAFLGSIGRPIGDMDALIAGVALARGQAIVTRNPRHFESVPGLEVVTY